MCMWSYGKIASCASSVLLSCFLSYLSFFRASARRRQTDSFRTFERSCQVPGDEVYAMNCQYLSRYRLRLSGRTKVRRRDGNKRNGKKDQREGAEE